MEVQIKVEGHTFSTLQEALDEELARFVGSAKATVELVQVTPATATGSTAVEAVDGEVVVGPVYAMTYTYTITPAAPTAEAPATTRA